MAAGQWRQDLMGGLAEWSEAFLAFLPSLGAAAGILLGGWLVARLLRGASRRIARTLDRGMVGLGRQQPPLAGAAPEALGTTVFWLVILAAVTGATQILALDSFAVWLARLAGYLPTLLTGVLIVAAGFFLSVIVRNLTAAAVPVTLPQGALLGRLLQAVILVTAMVLGADQMGLDVTFLVTLGTVLAGAMVGGLALALSLGSGPFVANLLGAHQLRQHFRVGQRVRTGGHEGRIARITAVSLVLDTPEGRVHLPAKIFHESAVVAVPEEVRDG
ncbi:mechanosensitive ion channel family protein [Thiohalorhabdus sp.]|uniref:mechanosensitive ion channel family protein n=1 Tax=Thiohalorhabdus sp. TaxID=3094134 RepID=UPI002FC3BAE7